MATPLQLDLLPRRALLTTHQVPLKPTVPQNPPQLTTSYQETGSLGGPEFYWQLSTCSTKQPYGGTQTPGPTIWCSARGLTTQPLSCQLWRMLRRALQGGCLYVLLGRCGSSHHDTCVPCRCHCMELPTATIGRNSVASSGAILLAPASSARLSRVLIGMIDCNSIRGLGRTECSAQDGPMASPRAADS